MLMVALLAVQRIARHIQFRLESEPVILAGELIYGCLVVVFWALIGVFVVYALVIAAMMIVRALEIADRWRYRTPEELIARAGINARKYDREEGGINRFQNHLASLTRVKPGPVRAVMLRLTLFAINLLARFWFNRGDLGGIPTILSARWVLVDRGRKLLFLDNYGGAWESYLNEFIDMTAVKGLNAIWTNTFVSVRDDKTVQEHKYTFPLTNFLIWGGAQRERPFKAYVRQSQVETLAWYSAYPTLSVTNINDNTAARQSLIDASSLAETDAILQRL